MKPLATGICQSIGFEWFMPIFKMQIENLNIYILHICTNMSVEAQIQYIFYTNRGSGGATIIYIMYQKAVINEMTIN